MLTQRTRGLLGIMAMAAGGAACVAPPDAELKNALSSFDNAVETEAALYAQPEWQLARNALAAARRELAFQDSRLALRRDYRRAITLLDAAESASRAAGRAAIAGKREIRFQAEVEIARAETAMESAVHSLALAVRAPQNRIVAEGLEIELAAVADAIEEARLKLDHGRFMDALKQSMSAGLHTDVIQHRIRLGLRG